MALSLTDFVVPEGRVLIIRGIFTTGTITSAGDMHATNPIAPTSGTLTFPSPSGYRVGRIRRTIGAEQGDIRIWEDDGSPSSLETFGDAGTYSEAQMHIQTEDDGVVTLNPRGGSGQGSSFSNWDIVGTDTSVIANIEGGDEVLLAFTNPPPNIDADFEAEAGDPTFAATAESQTVTNRSAAFSADAGSPTFSVEPQNQQIITGGVGPTGYRFFIDLVESDHSALQTGNQNRVPNSIGSNPGANTELKGVIEFSGIDETGITIDRTALGDRFRNKGILGISEFASITLKGYIETESDGSLVASSAAARLGRAARYPWYPARNLRIRHFLGFEEQVKVVISKARRVPSKDERLMWEVTLEPAMVEEDDFSTLGV